MDLLDQIKSLHWGILKSDYQKIFLDKNWQPKHPTDNALIFGYTYLSHPVFVTAYFFDGTDELGRLIFGCNNLSDDELKKIYRKIINDLIKNYGEPQLSESLESDLATPIEFRMTEIKKWKTSDSIITVLFALAESGTITPGIGIVWGDITKDPTSRRWSDSELSDGRKPEKLSKDFILSEAQREEIRKSME